MAKDQADSRQHLCTREKKKAIPFGMTFSFMVREAGLEGFSRNPS